MKCSQYPAGNYGCVMAGLIAVKRSSLMFIWVVNEPDLDTLTTCGVCTSRARDLRSCSLTLICSKCFYLNSLKEIIYR